MNNSFENDCYTFISEVKGRYVFNKREILLWIYLNMYIYRQGSFPSDGHYKQHFMAYLKKDKHFHLYYKKYEEIQEMEYLQLWGDILDRYLTHNCLFPPLQVMEQTYEGMLEDGLRSKTGSYYTPQPIVQYMTIESIFSYIDSKSNPNRGNLKDYLLGKSNTLSMDYILQVIQLLEEIKIIDIACGGGIFLRQSLQTLYSIKKNLFQLIGKDYKEQDLVIQILQNNLYGIDIQEETVMLCKLLLLIEAEDLSKSSFLDVDIHVFNEDALTMDFSKTIADQNHFHIVLGNPPYIGERGNKALFQAARLQEFGKKYYERNMDYFYFFIYKAYEILKQNGVLCYITTNYFVTADGAKKLRDFIKNNLSFKEIINFNTLNIFVDAKGQHNMIFLLEKSHTETPVILRNFSTDVINNKDLYEILLQEKKVWGIEKIKVSKDKLYDNKGQISIQYFGNEGQALEKIEKKGNYLLEDVCYVNQGIVSGADRLTVSWAAKLGLEKFVGAGIFVLTKEELDSLKLDENQRNMYVKDFYKNSHIKKYYTLKEQGLYLLYIDDHNSTDLHQIPSLYDHLSKYKRILLQRREVQKGTRKWYALQWPRNKAIFEGEKIVAPQRALENSFSYSEGPWYASADVYYITAKNKDVSLYYLLGLLNSSLMHYWLFYRGKRKGEYLELYATPLKGIPIYYSPSTKKCKAIENLVKHMMENVHDKNIFLETQARIDRLVFQLYGLTEIEERDIMNFIRNRRR